MTLKAEAGIVLVDPRDQQAVRNIDNVLTLYQMMINENKAEEGTAKFLTPDYIQHNPLIADGSASLGKYFAGVKTAHPNAHVVVHRIIAVGDYVFAHVNFVNLLTDDPNDAGGRRRRHLQNEREWQGRRTLGCAAASREFAEFGPLGRPQHPQRQFERNVPRRSQEMSQGSPI
jgi:predicted SnoaL-like aldol condensation-catalyzing enzyme